MHPHSPLAQPSHHLPTRPRVRALRAASRLAAAVALGALCGLGGACSGGPNEALAGPEYPGALKQAEVVDIQVIRDETRITLTNTTPRRFGASRLWLNRYYSKEIEALDVGETISLSLWDFRDEYGEAFEAGGFFATRKPDALVQAQLETEGELVGLVVAQRPDED